MIAFLLLIAGAAAAVWGLAHYQPAARLLGVVPAAPQAPAVAPKPITSNPGSLAAPPPPSTAGQDARIAGLEARLTQVEAATHQAQGSAGRADALVVAFAARRAIERGVALGYLENLLVERFGGQHRAAVATIISSSRQPVRLNDLIDQYQALGPELERGAPQDNWWTGLKRQLGSIVEIRRADQPAANPEARYARALQWLEAGNVDRALAETMRLPGAAGAGDWVSKARRYVAAERALDEVESGALLAGANPSA
jgi:hypothetical protein